MKGTNGLSFNTTLRAPDAFLRQRRAQHKIRNTTGKSMNSTVGGRESTSQSEDPVTTWTWCWHDKDSTGDPKEGKGLLFDVPARV
ncbi:hypothetical protein Naga_100369g2 [Nannochloropsis gaditana]|uniref:Uncharacterized protein n=1 Tax=Nannochloropsis gaditana TaxID=72520 RepID=W7TMS6_9STRA|nr:hypothetical protein Naga_100369g2 [Nannochloropsis gaditana]